MKRAFLLLIISLFALACLISCGKECDHTDENADNICDVCGESVCAEECKHEDGNKDEICDVCGQELTADPVITLVKDGKATFTVLVASNASSELKGYAGDFIRELNKYYIEDGDVCESYDSSDLDPGTEIILGPVTSRGYRFNVDTHYLGYKGFAIEAIRGKIFITAGGSTGYRKAIDYLKNDILMLEDYDGFVDELTVKSDMTYKQPQTVYEIEA